MKQQENSLEKEKKNEEEQKEEEVEKEDNQIEEESKIARFIYVTEYYDANTVNKINRLFEEINTKAFDIKDHKDYQTKELTEDEMNNNNIDYISGVEIVDRVIRILIIEGIQSKAIQKIIEAFPKKEMNNEKNKIFYDSRITDDKRIFSKFGLKIKVIRLKDTLSNILLTYELYQNCNKSREAYNAIINLGNLLNSQSMKEIIDWNLIDGAESYQHLEMKYGDILTKEDYTGVKGEKKEKKRFRGKSITDSMNRFDISTKYSKFTQSIQEIPSSRIATPQENLKITDEIQTMKSTSKERQMLDTYNFEYLRMRESFGKKTKWETLRDNVKLLKTIRRKENSEGHFCKPLFETTPSLTDTSDIFFGGGQRKNCYVNWVETMRQKYIHDKNNYYTYSKYGLTLSFPLITTKNQKYLDYVDNKSRWVSKNDFDRYKQYLYTSNGEKKKEFAFFPKIKNVL